MQCAKYFRLRNRGCEATSQGNRIDDLFTKQVASLHDLSLKDKAHFFRG